MLIGHWHQGPTRKGKGGVPIPGHEGKVFEIHRDGRKKRLGGNGEIWRCGCPRGDLYGVENCPHLQAIFDSKTHGSELPRQLRLTSDGRRAAARCRMSGCLAKAA